MNFAMLITLISSPIATSLFPAFSKLDVNSSEVKAMFKYSVKYASALVVPAAIFISVMSRDLVYGESYSHAPLYLTLYTSTFSLSAIGFVLESFFSGIGDSKINLNATIISAAFFIPSAIALTLKVKGVLIAMILSTAASVLYRLWIAARKYGLSIDPKGSASICLAASAAVARIIPLALYSPLPRTVNIAAAALLYLLIYLTLLPPQDIN